MPDYEKLIDQLFEKKNIGNNIAYINNLIHSLINEQEKQTSSSGDQDVERIKQYIFKILPKFEFKEKSLGQPDTQTRQEFRNYFSKNLSKAVTLEQKISFINKICSEVPDTTKKVGIDDALSTLMILKIVEYVVKEASPGAGGYQFESLLAAMFATGQQVVGDVRSSAVDITIGKEKYQVKLIKQGGSVGVAFSNMEKYFSQDQVQALGFLIAEKGSDDSLVLYRYFLQKKDYVTIKNQILTKRAAELDKKIKIQQPQQQAQTLPQQTELPLSEQELFEMILEQVAGQQPAQQTAQPDFSKYDQKELMKGDFYLPRKLFVQYKIGEISVSPNIFSSYSQMLKDSIGGVLENLSSLIDNVNKFYIQNDPNAANAAIGNASQIQTNILKK